MTNVQRFGPDILIFIHNDACSKCAGLAEELSQEGYAWETVRYMEGELTEELVRQILRDYDGPRSDLIRTASMQMQSTRLP